MFVIHECFKMQVSYRRYLPENHLISNYGKDNCIVIRWLSVYSRLKPFL